MAHKKWMHIYWKRFECNACLPTADLSSADDLFPAFVMVASLFLPHFRVLFCFHHRQRRRRSLSASLTAAFVYLVRRYAVFFIPPSRILFRHLAANNSLRFVEPVSQSGNRRGAAPPPSRRTRINSACDSRGHDCRCAGRHVIFWHTQTETPEGRWGGVVAAAVSSGSVMHHPCWRGLFTRAVVGLLSPTLPLCAAEIFRRWMAADAAIHQQELSVLCWRALKEKLVQPPHHTPHRLAWWVKMGGEDALEAKGGPTAAVWCVWVRGNSRYVRHSPKFSFVKGGEKVQLSLIQAVNKATCWGPGLCSPLWVRMLNSDIFCLFVLFFSHHKWNETAIRPTLTVHKPEVKAMHCVYRRKYGRTHVVGVKIMTEWW